MSRTGTEHTFTHMLRKSGEVLAEVEHRDVVLRRRDGEDLFLGLRPVRSPSATRWASSPDSCSP